MSHVQLSIRVLTLISFPPTKLPLKVEIPS